MKTEKNILVAFLLNISFCIIEFIGGLFSRSIAILSDSLHDFGDALSIGISYFLEKKSKNKPDDKHTYGYVRYSVLGSIITTVILLVGSVFVIYESIKRIINPVEVNYDGMLIIAIFGVVINFLAAYFTREGDSLNQKSVNLHMLEDVLGWVIVLIGSIIIKFTNIYYVDSIMSMIVAIFILVSAFKNLLVVLDLFLEKTPKDVNLEEIKKHLLSVPGVKDIHHIHVRSIDGYNLFITFHVVVDKYDSKIKQNLKCELCEHGINHSTIEFEVGDENCHDKMCTSKRIEHHHHHH